MRQMLPPLFLHHLLLLLSLRPSHPYIIYDSSFHSTSSSPVPSKLPPCQPSDLLQTHSLNSISGGVCVQPVTDGTNHTNLSSFLKLANDENSGIHHGEYRGVMLFDPLSDTGYQVDVLESLSTESHIRGVRVNPNLFPAEQRERLETNDGLVRVMKRCAETRLPVSFLSMSGYSVIRTSFLSLLSKTPSTPVLLDHYGFNDLRSKVGDSCFLEMMGDLRQADQGGFKASAGFRLRGEEDVRKGLERGWDDDEVWGRHIEDVLNMRLEPGLRELGVGKVMWGSDYPFIGKEGQGWDREMEGMRRWVEKGGKERIERERIMGENCRRWYTGMEREFKDTIDCD